MMSLENKQQKQQKTAFKNVGITQFAQLSSCHCPSMFIVRFASLLCKDNIFVNYYLDILFVSQTQRKSLQLVEGT